MWFVRLIIFHFLFLPLRSGFAVYFSLCFLALRKPYLTFQKHKKTGRSLRGRLRQRVRDGPEMNPDRLHGFDGGTLAEIPATPFKLR